MKFYITLTLCYCSLSLWTQTKYEITNLKQVNTDANEYSPAIYDGGLIFCSDRAGTGHFLFSTSAGQAKPRNFELLNLKNNDSNPSFTEDGAVFFFMRQAETGKSQILSATKGTEGWQNSWTPPLIYPQYNIGYPCLSSDGTVLYFSSDMPGGYGGWDLYVSYLDGEKWSPAINLGEKVNSAADEIAPFYDNNQQLFFASNGINSIGGYDIFVSYNDRPCSFVWNEAHNLGETINTRDDEKGFVKIDGKRAGFFASNRASGLGGFDIYTWKKK